MYKSLLVVSLFTLSASAMSSKEIAAVTAAYTTCTVTTLIGGPVPGLPCFLKAASVYGVVHALGMAHDANKELELKKELYKKESAKTESAK